MYKKKLIKLSTVTLAMSMAFAAPVTAYAEDTQYPSQAETWTNEFEASIEYTGDVTTDSDTLSTAYSDNHGQVFVDGNVTNKGNWRAAAALHGSTVVVSGNATGNASTDEHGNNAYTVTAYDNSAVSVGGNVISGGNGVLAQKDAAVTVVEDVTANNGNGVTAERGSSIIIGEDVTASKDGTLAYTGSTIVVGGNVTAGNYGVVSNTASETAVTGNVKSDVYGINSYYNGSITVLGDVDAGYTGIIIDETSQIAVAGDVNAGNNGILIDYNNNYKYPRDENNNIVVDGKTLPGGTHDENNNVLIRGKLSVSDDDGTAIVVRNNNDNPYNTNEIIKNLPTIIVYELDAANLSRVEDNSGEVDTKEVSDYIENHIEYVIEKDPETSNYFSIVDGGKIYDYDEDNNDILTMTIQQAIIVAAAEGYQISGGDNVTVTENEDGTFLVQLANNKGGVTISASLTQIRTASPAESVVTVSTPVAENSSSSNNSATENETPAAPFIYATFTILNKTNDSSVLGATRDGVNTEVEYSARPVVNVVVDGPLTAIEYKNAFINSIKNAPVNGIVRLETSAVSCIDKQMMESLADRPDVILEITFPVNNEKVTVSIPAGYDVMSLINEDGYCGFLNLLAIFGPAQNN